MFINNKKKDWKEHKLRMLWFADRLIQKYPFIYVEDSGSILIVYGYRNCIRRFFSNPIMLIIKGFETDKSFSVELRKEQYFESVKELLEEAEKKYGYSNLMLSIEYLAHKKT